jgi:hypothetical protein
MYDNGMSPKVASARCMPANPGPVGQTTSVLSLKEILMYNISSITQGDSHV